MPEIPSTETERLAVCSWSLLATDPHDLAVNIDSFNISTPEHLHAPTDMAAMQLGEPVCGQKPLAHGLHEVCQMTGLAKRQRVVMQMGIQVHSTAYYRMAVSNCLCCGSPIPPRSLSRQPIKTT